MAKTKTRLNIFGIFSELGQIILILALIVVAIVSFGARIPFLADRGFRFFAVTSGSMTPAIPVGSLIKAGTFTIDDLKEGDIVTYQYAGEDGQTATVTHRIAKIHKLEEVRTVGEGEDAEEKTFVKYDIKTKGDANKDEDDYFIGPDNIIGRYEWHIPFVGYISAFAHSPAGFILMVLVPATILIVWEIVSLVLHFKQGGTVKSDVEVEKLKAEIAKLKAGQEKN